MDGATFEIWIPKREEEEEEKREVSYYRPGERPGASEPHHQSVVGQEKKHFGLITILNDSKGMRSSSKIRQLGNRRLLKPQSGEDFHLRSLCRGHVLILAVEPLPS